MCNFAYILLASAYPLPSPNYTILVRGGHPSKEQFFLVDLDDFHQAAWLPHEWYYWTHELACSGDFLQYIKKWEKLVLQHPNDIQHLNMLVWMHGEANIIIEKAEQLVQRCFELDKKAENDLHILDT